MPRIYSHVDQQKERIEMRRGRAGGREGSTQQYSVQAVGAQRQCFRVGKKKRQQRQSWPFIVCLC